ncbi:MAG TPA: hypothetical protein VGR56_08130 [Nitrososphaerales archaeon]|nr:hypothetical protein [Nitrososphaerales archaeon]
MTCKYCLSEAVKPAGSVKGRKLVRCVDCRKRFIENQNLPRMKVNKHVIVSALSMYYDGLSVRKVSRQLENIFGERISQMTIWNWGSEVFEARRRIRQDTHAKPKREVAPRRDRHQVRRSERMVLGDD